MLAILQWLSSLVSQIFLGGYTSAQNVFPKPLSSKEEAHQLRLLWEGDQQARDVLIEHNLRLVAHIAKKYAPSSGYESDDFISIGTIGLIKAIGSFKPEKGIRLATYAARCIENAKVSQRLHFRRIAANGGCWSGKTSGFRCFTVAHATAHI